MKSEKVNKSVPQVSIADPIKEVISATRNENVWPKTIDDAQLDMQSSDKVQRSVTFAYDYWLIEDAG